MMPVHPQDDVHCLSDSADEQDGLLPSNRSGRSSCSSSSSRKVRKRLVAFGGAAGLILGELALLGGLALAVKYAGGSVQVEAPPLTARMLLESGELADVATDNLMAIGKGELASLGRDAVRTHVSRRLQSISSQLQRQYPEAHDTLGSLQLSAAQKESVLHVLRHYRDERLVSLASDLADAARETVEESGDREHFRRRLAEKLAPRLGEMRRLSEEMFPGSGESFALDLDQLDVLRHFDEWRYAPEAVAEEQAARRLASSSATVGSAGDAQGLAAGGGVDDGVEAQAQTFFEALEGHFGEKMPKAPARMLSGFSMFDIDDDPPPPPQQQGQPAKKQSFMQCIMKAVPHPIKVAGCIANNVKEVMKLMMKYFKAKTR